MYATVAVDPPWPQKGAGALRGREGWHDATGPSKVMPYPTMTVGDILRFPINDFAAPDCHCYLWTTNAFLRQAFVVMNRWGFSYSTTLVWAKNPMGGGLGGAWGIATEYILFGRRGTLPALAKVGRNWFNWKRPYDERGKPRHSAKPNEFYEHVELVSPAPRIELFARDARAGWAGWGDEYALPSA